MPDRKDSKDSKDSKEPVSGQKGFDPTKEPGFAEYPKWVDGRIVGSKEEEDAVKTGGDVDPDLLVQPSGPAQNMPPNAAPNSGPNPLTTAAERADRADADSHAQKSGAAAKHK